MSRSKSERTRPLTAVLRWVFAFLALGMPALILYVSPAPVSGEALDRARLAAWLASLLGMFCLFLQAGFEIKGRALGALIDERNRYSLSRLQMTLWSILVLGSIYVVYMANIMRSSGLVEALNVNLDWNLIVLMGISAASFITSPIVLSRKAAEPGNDAELGSAGRQLAGMQGLAEMPVASGSLVTKRDPRDARVADLIRGEEIGNATVVDISRTQMLIITLLAVIAYAATVGKAIGGAEQVLDHLPELHQTLLGLILVSHGSYISGKITPSTRSSSAISTEYLARSLQLSQRATELVRATQGKVDSAQPGSLASTSLSGTLTLATAAAAQAAALPARVAAPDFKVDELSALEGRVDALFGSLRSLSGESSMQDVSNAPTPQLVKAIQRKLRELGCQDVTDSGIPDAATDSAIRVKLAEMGVDRSDLHPNLYRYYEELGDLLGVSASPQPT